MWFRGAAEKDYTAAWHALGSLYASGTGTAKDEASAITWFRQGSRSWIRTRAGAPG